MRRAVCLLLVSLAAQGWMPEAVCAEQYLMAPAVPMVDSTPAQAADSVPGRLPSAPAGPGGIVPTAGPGQNQVPLAAPALTFSAISKTDALLPILDAVSVTDWKAEPTQIYAGINGDYATANGAHPSLPPSQPVELLQEFHCSHIFIKRLVRTQRAVVINVYTFKEPAEAYGAYSTMRLGSSNILVRGDASSEDDASISFWKGRRFVVLTTTAEDDDISKQTISNLADDLCRSINEHAVKPNVINGLPVLDRVSSSERLFFGPQAARKYINPPHLRSLLIERSSGAAFAEYQFPHPDAERMKVLVVDYPDAQSASRTFVSYVTALGMSHKAQFVQPDVQLCKINDSYMLSALSGQRITLITGARRKISLLMLHRAMPY